MPLPFRHLTSSRQLTPEVVKAVFGVIGKMEQMIQEKGRTDLLREKVIAHLFYEPSSRTMLSFEAAAERLGAGMILAQGKEMSSLKKGESIEDTIRMVMEYADLIVMRHPESGAADRAASISTVPFINAGDGWNEHPTQALLDLYTIQKEKGTLEGLYVSFACDPLHSRTIRSLALALSQFQGNHFTFSSPLSLRMSDELRKTLTERGVPFTEVRCLEDALDADILYMNRLQEERFTDRTEFQRCRSACVLRAPMLRGKNILIMDPLPRVDEISPEVDHDRRAAYFRQAENGLYVRMALLNLILVP